MAKNEYYAKFQRDGKKIELIITAYSKHQINKHFHWTADFLILDIATEKDKKRKNVKFLEFSEDTPEKTLAEIIEGANEKAEEYRKELHKAIECTYTRMAECKTYEAWDLNVVDELQQHAKRTAAIEESYNEAFSEYYKLKGLYKELFNKDYKN